MKIIMRTAGVPYLLSILLFNAVLFTVGINWGLPNTVSWMADSLAPWDPLVGLTQAFSFGYFNKYPMMHQLLLAVLYLPMVLYAIASHADPAGFQLYQFLHYVRSAEFATVLIYIGRFVSVLMGVGTVYYLYRAVKELFGEKAGIWAAVLLSFNTVLNFYAHTAKVEVPHVFWAVAALYYLIRVAKYDVRRDYICTAVFACMSFGTKDQAYAVFVLPFLLYLFVYPVLRRREGIGISKVLFSKNALIFAVVFVAGTLFVENVILNWEGFLYRFRHLTGEGGSRSIHYALTPVGIYALWRDVFQGISTIAMGKPVFAISVTGVILMFAQGLNEKKNLLLQSLFIVAMLSFMIFFVQIIRQSAVRFVFILSILLTVYGGYAIAFAFERCKSVLLLRITLIILLALCGIYSFHNTFSVNINLLYDARYDAEEWMKRNIPRGAAIEYYTYTHYLPRFPLNTYPYRIKSDYFAISKRNPDYLVLNSTMIERNMIVANAQYGEGIVASEKNKRLLRSGRIDFIKDLVEGNLNYVEAYRGYFTKTFFKRLDELNISSNYIVIYKKKDVR